MRANPTRFRAVIVAHIAPAASLVPAARADSGNNSVLPLHTHLRKFPTVISSLPHHLHSHHFLNIHLAFAYNMRISVDLNKSSAPQVFETTLPD